MKFILHQQRHSKEQEVWFNVVQLYPFSSCGDTHTKITIFNGESLNADKPWNAAQINWPAYGGQEPPLTALFAQALQKAAKIAVYLDKQRGKASRRGIQAIVRAQKPKKKHESEPKAI